MLLPWILCILLFVMSVLLFVKVNLLKKNMDEIRGELAERLATDTNTLICVSTSDKHIRHFAAELNRQLSLLHRQRRQYLNGNRELKHAVVNISHDLRTPLTAICGYLELLENEEKSENAERYIGLIENRTDALKQLTEELFRYSVIISTAEDMQWEAVNVNDALEESITVFYAALKEKDIVPDIHIPEEKIIRYLNKTALTRVFGNVLHNAVKYSDGDLKITLCPNGEINFTNTASGLNEVQAGKLFDRFFTVKAAGNATGLGLSIAKTLVEQMNGTIDATYQNNELSIRIMFTEMET